MATPVKPSSNVPAEYQPPTDPVPVMAPFGWLLILAAGIGLILATWVIYAPDTYADMWAGYRDGVIGTAAIVCAMSLRTTLPKAPALGLVGLLGVCAVLCAVFLENSGKVFVSELTAGIVLLVGTVLYAGGDRAGAHRR